MAHQKHLMLALAALAAYFLWKKYAQPAPLEVPSPNARLLAPILAAGAGTQSAGSRYVQLRVM